jgi:hypothetical protein
MLARKTPLMRRKIKCKRRKARWKNWLKAGQNTEWRKVKKKKVRRRWVWYKERCKKKKKTSKKKLKTSQKRRIKRGIRKNKK